MSCNEKYNLKSLDANYKVYEKNRAFIKNNITVEESKIENILGTEYIIEEKVIFDDKGILQLYRGGSEGFIVHSRGNDPKTLPIENQEQYKKIIIDRDHNYIIDNYDTIKEFKILLEEKIIITDEIKDGRIYIYKYN